MGRLSQNDLAAVLTQKHGLSRKQALQFVNSIATVIMNGLERDRLVKVRRLGTFKIVDVDTRESVNVNTGERLIIDGHSKLAFLPDAAMKELVNKPFSMFDTVVLNDDVDFSESAGSDTTTAAQGVDGIATMALSEADEEPVEMLLPDEDDDTEPMEQDPEEETEPVVEEAAENIVPVVENAAESIEPVVEETAPEVIPVPESNAVPEEEEPEAEEEPKAEEEPEPENLALVDTEAMADEPAGAACCIRSAWKLWLPITILALVAGFGAGFFTARYCCPDSSQPQAAAQQTASAEVAAVPTDTTAASTAQPTDTITPAGTTAQADTAMQAEPQQLDQPQQAEAAEPEWEKYNNMDVRTRDGAYFIMGFDRNETVREGDNTRLIARRIFGGTDMACYIEVYNGISADTELQPGTQLKIPRIELKKIVRKRLKKQNNKE